MNSFVVAVEEFDDDRQVLRIVRNGKVILDEVDRGELEDNSFYRDWAWVQGAIEMAYSFGFDDGIASIGGTDE